MFSNSLTQHYRRVNLIKDEFRFPEFQYLSNFIFFLFPQPPSTFAVVLQSDKLRTRFFFFFFFFYKIAFMDSFRSLLFLFLSPFLFILHSLFRQSFVICLLNYLFYLSYCFSFIYSFVIVTTSLFIFHCFLSFFHCFLSFYHCVLSFILNLTFFLLSFSFMILRRQESCSKDNSDSKGAKPNIEKQFFFSQKFFLLK